MAERIALQVDINTGEAVSSLGQLEKATKKVGQTTKGVAKDTQTLDQQFDALNKEIKESPVNIRAMNKQIQQYQAIALEAGRTSPLGKQAIQKAAALKDKYIDIQNEVNRLANDGVKLKAVLDIGSTMVAGFAGFQGVMALAGGESEELRETMVKLQGAMSLLMAVETLRKNLEKESTIVLVAKNTAEKAGLILTKATTVAQKALGLSTDSTTKSFKLMRGALIATGIGALVVLIGTLISQWDNITAALSSASKEQKALNETMEAAASAAEEVYVEVNKVETAFKLAEEGVISKEEALNTYNTTIGKTLGEAESLEEAEQKFKDGTADYVKMAMLRAQSQELIKKAAAEQTKALLENTKDSRTWADKTVGYMNNVAASAIDWSTGGLLNVKETSDKLNNMIAEGREKEAVADANAKTETYLTLNKSIQEQIALIEDKDTYISESEKKQTDTENEEADKRAANRKKRLANKQKQAELERKLAEKNEANLKKIAEKAAADLLIREEEQFHLLQQLRNTDQENEINDLVLQYEKKFELANGNAELETALAEQQAIDIAAINKKYADEEAALKVERKALEKAADDKADDDDLQREADIQNAKLQMAQNSIGALMNLTTAFAKDNEKSQRRAFEINKKLQIAQAMISTYQAAQGAYASATLNPITIGFPAYPGIMAAIAVAGGLANVATIAKQQFQSSSPGGSAGGSAPGFSGGVGGGGSVPTLNPISNTNTVLGQDNKVYVTETDISNTQNKVKVIEEQATF